MEIKECVRGLFEDGVRTTDVIDAFTVEHLNAGFRFVSRCSLKVTNEGTLDISGRFYEVSGKEDLAGYFHRSIYRKAGVLRAYHHSIFVEPQYRRKGLALSHYTKAIRFYHYMGVKFISLFAEDDGPIVWPQFEFVVDEKSIQGSISKIAAGKLQRIDPGYRTTALERVGPRFSGLRVTYNNHIRDLGLAAIGTFYEKTKEPIGMTLSLRDPQVLRTLRERGILESEEQ